MEEATNLTLEPSPESVVALIDQIVTLGWPDRDEDQAGYFRQLGFQQGEGQEGFQKGCGYSPGPDSPDDVGGELLSSGLAVSNASWASDKGQLFSFGFFLYEGRNSRENGAVLGYRAIYS